MLSESESSNETTPCSSNTRLNISSPLNTSSQGAGFQPSQSSTSTSPDLVNSQQNKVNETFKMF